MPIPAHEFRQTLGRWASGVTIVTVSHGTEVHGMTASAFLSVSLDPPLILVAIDRGAHMHGALEEADRFGVSILSNTQRELSNHFARRGGEMEVPWVDFEGLPLIGGAIAQLVCRRTERHAGGDHTLFVGEVEYSRYTDDDPLVYFRGQYHELG
ncbi:flavin reductase family protein [Deinococcus peraridilitoris]|uniref:Conserved protein of DIM6/NTAB family n=1 Tax=Deinococcus peraridilitoris (strain DSM 19664 / LMG 22246 / CIP 109416 / KR-200) TaxID=937777 RepID=K9ZYG9_DEIPD|nr:flavin reductase family protein [Deinococcus peraridilitoris]AFZ66693.1 conserved protein of DIM6/NTAB family [Deinococcus peraridilitoris DSM 19664]